VHIVFSFLASTTYRFTDKAVAILVGASKNMEGRLVTMVFEITGVRKRVAEFTSNSCFIIARSKSLLIN
jgi:hypothetical protein